MMRPGYLPLTLLMLFSATASAQGWSGSLGVGMAAAPRYSGGDEYKSRVLPYFQFEHANRVVVGIVPSGSGLGVGTYLVRTAGFSAELDIAQSFTRQEKFGSALAGMGDRRGNTLVGTSVSVTRGILTATSNVVVGVSGDVGAYGTAELSARQMLTSRWMAGLSTGATFATEGNMRNEFGITASQAARRQQLIDANDPRLHSDDGQTYAPDAGLKQAQGGAQLMYALSQRRTVVMFWQYSRLSDAAFTSSLVRSRNSTNTGAMLVFAL